MSEQTQQSAADKPVALIGAPTDIGAGARGGSMGPEALRVAGLTEVLRNLGRTVEDRGNLTGPFNPEQPSKDGYRHLPEVSAWCHQVRDAMYQAMVDGCFPILLGGDHCLAVGSVAAVARYCAEQERPLTVLWMDAHADFNTCDTTPSGNIHGMPVAILAGHGPANLTEMGHRWPILEAHRVIQVGIRSVDRVEKVQVVENKVVVYDMRTLDERGMRAVMDEALNRAAADDSHLHVSFDVDFLDPAIAPGVATRVQGGPTYREAQLAMEMIHDSGLMHSLDLMELNPAFDTQNKTAALVVDLVGSLFGEQILNRHKVDY
ncbi:MAG: arginase [Pseudomonadota bacterium]